MSQTSDANSNPQQSFTSENSSYAVLNAYDALALARCSEIYLQALEHYILVNPQLDKVQVLQFLRLYQIESAKQLNLAADNLKEALGMN